jgi:hypothetical protein
MSKEGGNFFIKYRDPVVASFSSKDIVLNVQTGTIFYKRNRELFQIRGTPDNFDLVVFPGQTTNQQILINDSSDVNDPIMEGTDQFRFKLASATCGCANYFHIGAETLTHFSGSVRIGEHLGGTCNLLDGEANPALKIYGNLGVVNNPSGSISSSAELSGHIAADGNISASGNLYGSNAYIDTSIFHTGDTDTYINFNTNTINLAAGGSVVATVINTSFIVNSNITASGNISASGFISASNAYIDNNLYIPGTGNSPSTGTAILVMDTTTGEVFQTGSFSGGADNLGNHTATQNLLMQGFSIENALHITASGKIAIGGIDLVGPSRMLYISQSLTDYNAQTPPLRIKSLHNNVQPNIITYNTSSGDVSYTELGCALGLVNKDNCCAFTSQTNIYIFIDPTSMDITGTPEDTPAILTRWVITKFEKDIRERYPYWNGNIYVGTGPVDQHTERWLSWMSWPAVGNTDLLSNGINGHDGELMSVKWASTGPTDEAAGTFESSDDFIAFGSNTSAYYLENAPISASGTPDVNCVVFALVDETSAPYHLNFPLTGTVADFGFQPLTNYKTDYGNFIGNAYPKYECFSGYVYALPFDNAIERQQFALHVYAAIETDVVSPSNLIGSPFTGANLNAITGSNPYANGANSVGATNSAFYTGGIFGLASQSISEKHDFPAGISGWYTSSLTPPVSATDINKSGSWINGQYSMSADFLAFIGTENAIGVKVDGLTIHINDSNELTVDIETFKTTGQRSGNSVITGSLFLTGSSGHLTASGNISASGLLFASASLGFENIATYNSQSGQFFYTSSQGLSNQLDTFKATGQRSGNASITGSLFLTGSSGHLTASGNISASGYLIAQNITASANISASGDLVVQNITASGNISSSGTIYANNFQSTGGNNNGINFIDDVILTGNFTSSGNISASGTIIATSFTGSLQGNASTATTASFAQTASYVENAQTASYVENAQTASFVTTAQTASYVENAQTASYVENAQTASYVENAQTASYVTTAQTASYVENAQTASFVTTAQTASFVTTAQTASFVLNAISSSFATTASFVTTAQTASFVTTAQTASFVTTAQTASFVTTAQTASFVTLAQTASFVNTAQTASFVTTAQTASYVENAQTASYVENAQTASFVTLAQTASYVENAQTASYVENAQTASFVTTAQTASFVTLAQTANKSQYKAI